MKNPFDTTGKKGGRGILLGIDAWIDSSVYRFFHNFGEWWESVSIFFRRFRVTGFKKFLVEILDEGATLGLIGMVVMLSLALPAFDETKKDWRNLDNYSVSFLDRYGRVIGSRGIRQNTGEELDKLPDHFIKAVLATEDRRFFEHGGIDIWGLIRAFGTNLKANSVVQGGSTLTQQLAKNLFLSNERTISRKIKEVFLSAWLEVNLSKKEILKLYLDRTYMGAGNFGISAAAQFYFDKNIRDVNLAEAAMLAGLYKAPSKYAPNVNLPAARARANEVLTNMVQAGFMTEGQVIGARRHPASAVDRDAVEGPNYFLDWAYDQVKDISKNYQNRIFTAKTTVDLTLQKLAQDTITSMLRRYGRQYGVKEAAMVVLDHTGAVRAIVGGVDYGQSQFNRATKAVRQPGSSFKPFVYATSFDTFGYNDKTKVVDGPVKVGKWSPRNYSRRYHGTTTMESALLHSYNTIPVKLYVGRGRTKGIGGDRLMKKLTEMGITSKQIVSPAMVLGANGITALEMASAYGTFLNKGYRMNRHGIVTLRNDKGETLYDFKTQGPGQLQVFKPESVASINRILVQNPIRGTARRARLNGIPGAGKTGTTQSYRDGWYVGYTGNFVAAVWFGNDNYKPSKRMTGGSLPAMTWQRFMTAAHRNVEILPIPFINKSANDKNDGNQNISEDDLNLPVVERKLLSDDVAKTLRDLEQKLRDAKPLVYRQDMASNTNKKSIN